MKELSCGCGTKTWLVTQKDISAVKNVHPVIKDAKVLMCSLCHKELLVYLLFHPKNEINWNATNVQVDPGAWG